MSQINKYVDCSIWDCLKRWFHILFFYRGKNYEKINNNASSNYLATLKYLWKFAKEIAKHETGANVTTDVNNASAKALAQLPAKVKKSGTVAGNMIAQLDNMTKRIIKAHYKVTSAHPTQTEGGKCKYIIYGMLMHLLGDLYAHRLKVPKTSVEAFKSGFNSANFNSKKCFINLTFQPLNAQV